MKQTGVFLVAALVLLCAPACAGTGSGSLVVERVSLPVQAGAEDGAGQINLDALVARPNDGWRHPLAIINHGNPPGIEQKKFLITELRRQTIEFARRGWVAVAVSRRGFGLSEGEFSEKGGACNQRDYVAEEKKVVSDIKQVIQLMGAKDYVDNRKIIAVGHSSGGFLTAALTANPPPGLVAAISFAGGRGSRGAGSRVCSEGALIGAMADFGKTSRIPMLWVYTANDQIITLPLARRMFSAFSASGGKAEFVEAPPFDKDGHQLFSRDGVSFWTPYVDSFLQSQGLTSLSQPLPYDEEAGVVFPDGLSAQGRVAYLDYRDTGEHRAFARAENGDGGWSRLLPTAQEAEDEALADCHYHHPSCQVIAVDGVPVP